MLGRGKTFGVPEPPGKTCGVREGVEELPHSQWVFERQERRGSQATSRAEADGWVGGSITPCPRRRVCPLLVKRPPGPQNHFLP